VDKMNINKKISELEYKLTQLNKELLKDIKYFKKESINDLNNKNYDSIQVFSKSIINKINEIKEVKKILNKLKNF